MLPYCNCRPAVVFHGPPDTELLFREDESHAFNSSQNGNPGYRRRFIVSVAVRFPDNDAARLRCKCKESNIIAR